MQGVSAKVRVSKCLDLASYSSRMFVKFPTNANLAAIATELKEASNDLAASQSAYEASVRAIIPARVDVKFENLMSDRRIRLSQQRAEIADGKKDGKIASAVFPEGSRNITRLQGDSQIQAMADLEGRLEANQSMWSDAAAEKTDLAAHRDRYETAIKARHTAGQKARDLRAARDAAKERFVTKYTQIQSRVEAEFPRDKALQDLFFDEVRSKSALEEADAADEEPEGGEGAENTPR